MDEKYKMKKSKLLLLLIFCVIFLIVIPASAHQGRTDANGGHYDNETGEYHYHHGYEAHQHINGICPYNHDDKTNHTSGTSYSDVTPKPELHIETPDPYPAVIVSINPTSKPNNEHKGVWDIMKNAVPWIFLFVFTPLGWILFTLIYFLFTSAKERIIAVKNNKSNGVSPPTLSETPLLSESPSVEISMISVPEGYSIDGQGLPYKQNRVYGWGKEFNVFVTSTGKYFHRSKCPKIKGKNKMLLHRYNAMLKYTPCPHCKPKSYINDWYLKKFSDSPFITNNFAKSTYKVEQLEIKED